MPREKGWMKQLYRLMYGEGERPREISPLQASGRVQTGENAVVTPGGTSQALLTGRWLRLARRAWWIVAAVAAGIFIAALPAYVPNLGRGPSDVAASIESSARFVFAVDLLTALASITAVLVSLSLAAVLFRRKGDDWMALFVSYYLLGYGIVLAGPLDVLDALWPGTYEMTLVAQAIFIPTPSMTLLFLFPSGRFVPRWTRWLVPFPILLTPTLFPILPFTLPKSLDPLLLVAGIGWGSLFLVVVYAPIYRYRRVSTAVERQQTKWVVFGFVMWTMAAFLFSVPYFLRQLIPPGTPIPWWVPVSELAWFVSMNILPVSLAIAVLHYRLWDIDFIINRTLVYGALTASTMGIYVLIVGYLGNLFQARDRSLIALLTTGLVAVLFQPLRERLQRGVNRLMYGERDDPYTVLSRLGRRLEATLAPEAGLQTIVETVAQALKLPYVAIALKGGEGFEIVTSFGLRVSDPFILPLTYQAETIGQLICTPRAPGEEFTEADQRLLRNVARQAGAVAHAVRLTADLQRSRERLVSAREEERRRLRRDLHDGLGSALASHGLKLAAVRHLLAKDQTAAETLLDQMAAQNEATVAEIRRLVYALRPPALDELGLVEAIRDHLIGANGDASLPVRLQITIEEPPAGLPPLPAAVEVAAYRIALEALTNVARHARARNCVVCFMLDKTLQHTILQLEITDDGIGLPGTLRTGVGLTSMRERAEEVGGMCVVEDRPAGGTRVLARLPVSREI